MPSHHLLHLHLHLHALLLHRQLPAQASSASLLPFVAGAVGSLSAGALCDALSADFGLSRTRARKTLQSIACGAPRRASNPLSRAASGAPRPLSLCSSRRTPVCGRPSLSGQLARR